MATAQNIVPTPSQGTRSTTGTQGLDPWPRKGRSLKEGLREPMMIYLLFHLYTPGRSGHTVEIII